MAVAVMRGSTGASGSGIMQYRRVVATRVPGNSFSEAMELYIYGTVSVTVHHYQVCHDRWRIAIYHNIGWQHCINSRRW